MEKNFRTEWLTVEIAYSLFLDQGLKKNNNENNIIIENSLNNLKEMSENKLIELKDYLKK